MTKRHFAAAWHECRLKAARKKSQRGKKAWGEGSWKTCWRISEVAQICPNSQTESGSKKGKSQGFGCKGRGNIREARDTRCRRNADDEIQSETYFRKLKVGQQLETARKNRFEAEQGQYCRKGKNVSTGIRPRRRAKGTKALRRPDSASGRCECNLSAISEEVT
jgi:hypothetical protein